MPYIYLLNSIVSKYRPFILTHPRSFYLAFLLFVQPSIVLSFNQAPSNVLSKVYLYPTRFVLPLHARPFVQYPTSPHFFRTLHCLYCTYYSSNIPDQHLVHHHLNLTAFIPAFSMSSNVLTWALNLSVFLPYVLFFMYIWVWRQRHHHFLHTNILIISSYRTRHSQFFIFTNIFSGFLHIILFIPFFCRLFHSSSIVFCKYLTGSFFFPFLF